MLILCAWCRRDGEPGYLGEREPLDNPETTHSICAAHQDQLLESLPSRSFPDARLLIVVDRENIELYAQLQRVFLGLPGVQVLLDRRGSDRRSGSPLEWSGGRRRNTRRIRKGVISPLGGFTIVRFTPNAKPGAITGQLAPASAISASESAHRDP
jgi:hypothetical protein